MEYVYKINYGQGWKVVSQPVNHSAIRIDMNFTSASPTASISSIAFKFVGQTAKDIYAYYEAGANGGKGFTEGLPFQIDTCNGALLFDLMLDGANAATKLSCDEVDIPIKQAGRIDQINISSENISFWYLFSTGVITPSMYKQTPYCLNSIPNGTTVLVLALAEFMVIWQAIDLINKIQEIITKISGDLTAVPVSAGMLAADIIIAVAFIIYAYALINMFIKLAADIQDNIIQKKKYKKCMREEDIWLAIASHYKLNFVSPIYAQGSVDKNATYMPPKIVMPKTGQSFLTAFDRPENEANNPHTYGYPDGTINQFFQDMITKYDGDITITNSTIYFKNKYDWNVFSSYVIPNTSDISNTFNEPAPWGTNISELSPTLVLKFQVDDSDPNTKQKYRGTSVRVQINTPNPNVRYTGWGQRKEVTMPFALAKRKDYLNEVEFGLDQFVNGVSTLVSVITAPINVLIKAINKVISVFGGNPATIPVINPIPKNQFQQRIGWMEVWNDSFSIPKTFIGMQKGPDWVIAPTSEVNCSARGLLDRYYGYGLATRGNQYKTYEAKKFKMCCTEAQLFTIYNVFTVPDKGKKGKFTLLNWSLDDEIAENANYRIKENWSNILTESIVEDETI